mgnify:CR=1 FL=1
MDSLNRSLNLYSPRRTPCGPLSRCRWPQCRQCHCHHRSLRPHQGWRGWPHYTLKWRNSDPLTIMLRTLTSPAGDHEAVILLDREGVLRIVCPCGHGVRTLGSSGLTKEEAWSRSSLAHAPDPWRNVAWRHGLDCQEQTTLFVDWAVVDFIAFLGPGPYQIALIISSVDKVWLCWAQHDTVTAHNWRKKII